jgi:tripartite-type tricarboxylate transporter receptor subunit TctC
VKSGRLRALGVTPIKRVGLLPDVPTLDEAGIPGFDYTTWYGLMAPAATPRAIVDRLNAETVAQLNSATVQRRMEAQGLNAIPSTPAQFTTKLRSETEKWARAAAAAKILPE